jgi:hypothetical protein
MPQKPIGLQGLLGGNFTFYSLNYFTDVDYLNSIYF